MRRILTIFAGLALLVLAVLFGLDFYVQQQAGQRVDQILAGIPDAKQVQRGGVRYDLLNNSLKVDNLTLVLDRGAGVSLSLASLVLDQPQADGSGRYQAAGILAEGIQLTATGLAPEESDPGIVLSDLALSIASLRGRQVSLSSDMEGALRSLSQTDLGGLDDPAQFAPVIQLVKGLGFEDLDAGSFDLATEWQTPLPDERKSSLKYTFRTNRMTFGGLSSGQLSSWETGPWSQSIEAESEAVRNIAATGERLGLTGLSLANLAAVYGPLQDGEEETAVVIFETFETDKLLYKIPAGDEEGTIAISVESLTTRDYRLAPGAGQRFQALQGLAAEENISAMAAALGDIVSLYGLGGFSMEGLAIKNPQGQEVFALTGFQLSGLSGASLDEVALSGLSLDVPGKAAMQLKNFELRGLDYNQALANLESMILGEPWPRGSMPRIDRIALAGLELRQGEAKLDLASLSIESSDYVQSVATRGLFDMAGLVLPLAGAPDPNLSLAGQLLGLESMTFDAHIDYKWDVESETVTLKDSLLRIVDLAQLDLSLSLEGLGEGFIGMIHNEAPENVEELLRGITLAGAQIDYQDQSLLPKVFSALAAAGGQDEALVRETYKAQAQGFSTQFLAGFSRAEEIGMTLADFVEAPDRLRITLLPLDRLPIILLPSIAEVAPGDLAEALGLEVVVNP